MENLIIYDFDDTLFPTYQYISNKNNNLINYIDLLDDIVYDLLNKSLENSDVIIVTNGSKKWLNMILPLYTKSNILINNKIKIIYARETNNNFINYKIKPFIDFTLKHKNIISIGDSNSEYNALIYLINHNKNYLKNIKLINSPTIEELIEELVILKDSIFHIIMFNQHIDYLFVKN